MKSFSELINEKYLESGRAPLYHFTSAFALCEIMAEDAIGKYGHFTDDGRETWAGLGKKQFIPKGAISLTRDKTLNFGASRGGDRGVIVFDQDKLKQAGLIRPFRDQFCVYSGNPDDWSQRTYSPQEKVECEERIRGPLKGVDKYVSAYYLPQSTINELEDRRKKLAHTLEHGYEDDKPELTATSEKRQKWVAANKPGGANWDKIEARTKEDIRRIDAVLKNPKLKIGKP